MTEEAVAAPRARRDAVHNDQAVITAAQAVFAERGPHAGMGEIAQRAGVGVATIYRQFHNKAALLEAIAAQLAQEVEQEAARAQADPDPLRGLMQFLDHLVDFNSEKRRYAGALLEHAGEAVASSGTYRRVLEMTAAAVKAGGLTPGTTSEDILDLITAVQSLISQSGDSSAARRFLHVHLRGLSTETP